MDIDTVIDYKYHYLRMSGELDKMNIVKPFGPEIGEAYLPDDITEQLLSVCLDLENDTSKSMGDRLVGFIDKQRAHLGPPRFDILDKIKNRILTTIQQSVLEYLTKSYNVYSSYAPFNKLDLVCTDAWCSMQGLGEHNPIHSHALSDIVCVIFPLVDIDVTFNKYTRNIDHEYPGSLVFHSQSQDAKFGKSSYTVFPEAGKIYIFSGNLSHYTIPFFKNGDKRISVSCNFSLSENFYNLRRLRGNRN